MTAGDCLIPIKISLSYEAKKELIIIWVMIKAGLVLLIKTTDYEM